MFANLRRFLQAQRKVIFIPVAVFCALAAQIVALVILVNILGLGYTGACIALPISYWSMFLCLFSFTKCKVTILFLFSFCFVNCNQNNKLK